MYSRYPGKGMTRNLQPQRGCTFFFGQQNTCKMCNPVGVDGSFHTSSQGSANTRNPGLRCQTPLGFCDACANVKLIYYNVRFIRYNMTKVYHHNGQNAKPLPKKIGVQSGNSKHNSDDHVVSSPGATRRSTKNSGQMTRDVVYKQKSAIGRSVE